MGLIADHDEGHQLEGAHSAADDEDDGSGPGEIEMMEHSQNATGEVQQGSEQHCHGGGPHANQAQANEGQGDYRCGEDFEETFDPEVNDPPSPILRYC